MKETTCVYNMCLALESGALLNKMKVPVGADAFFHRVSDLVADVDFLYDSIMDCRFAGTWKARTHIDFDGIKISLRV